MLKDKNVTEFLFKEADTVEGHFNHERYINQPATAFLAYVISAKNAIEYCKTSFPKYEQNNHLNKESLIIVQHLINSTLASLMGHYETFQKYFFAGIFDRTVYLEKFNPSSFFKTLERKDNINLSVLHLLAYRSTSASTGVMLCDNLTGWHDPEKVNSYFNAFGLNNTLLSNNVVKDLKELWQLRHSIVHTGGTLTRPDAQKIATLIDFSDRNIIFSNKFIYELAKWLHHFIFDAVSRTKAAFEAKMITALSSDEKENILKFFHIESASSSWLK